MKLADLEEVYPKYSMCMLTNWKSEMCKGCKNYELCKRARENIKFLTGEY